MPPARCPGAVCRRATGGPTWTPRCWTYRRRGPACWRRVLWAPAIRSSSVLRPWPPGCRRWISRPCHLRRRVERRVVPPGGGVRPPAARKPAVAARRPNGSPGPRRIARIDTGTARGAPDRPRDAGVPFHKRPRRPFPPSRDLMHRLARTAHPAAPTMSSAKCPPQSPKILAHLRPTGSAFVSPPPVHGSLIGLFLDRCPSRRPGQTPHAARETGGASTAWPGTIRPPDLSHSRGTPVAFPLIRQDVPGTGARPLVPDKAVRDHRHLRPTTGAATCHGSRV